MFIAFDGIDGTGKTTQLRLLAEHLRSTGREVVTCSDPGSTALGDAVREILLGGSVRIDPMAEALLFMAARAELVAEVIRPALASGKIVVSDRFLLATIVYQGHAGGVDLAWLRQTARAATGGLEPDLTLVLDLPQPDAAGRIDRELDRMERRGAAFQARLRQGFLDEAAIAPERIVVVDASGTVEAVQQQVRSHIQARLAGVSSLSRPLRHKAQ